MSQPHDDSSSLVVITQAYERFNRSDLDGVLELLDADVEWVVSAATSIEPEVFHGHDGVRRDAERFLSTWSECTVQVQELTPCGRHVVADVLWVATATASGVPVQMRLGALWTVAGGKVTRFEQFPDVASARHAATTQP